MANFLNRARETTATIGTGTVTLGGASAPFQTWASAGAVNATQYDMLIEEGTAWEVSYGVYTTAGTTLTRTLRQSSTGSLLVLAGAATVTQVDSAQNLSFSGAMVRKAVDQTGANYTTLTAIAFDTEVFDVGGWHDNSVANTRLTVPVGFTGSYAVISANVVLANVTSDMWTLIEIRKGNTSLWDGTAATRTEIGAPGPCMSCTTGPVLLTAGEYYEIYLAVETDTSIDIQAARTNFSIQVVG